MHAFQNSHNLARKDNNWNILNLFFQKYTLRKVNIDASEYDKVKSGNDSKS